MIKLGNDADIVEDEDPKLKMVFYQYLGLVASSRSELKAFARDIGFFQAKAMGMASEVKQAQGRRAHFSA